MSIIVKIEVPDRNEVGSLVDFIETHSLFLTGRLEEQCTFIGVQKLLSFSKLAKFSLSETDASLALKSAIFWTR